VAIGRTALGTFTAKAAGPTFTLASIAVGAGNTLVVGVALLNGSAEPDTVKWGVNALTFRSSIGKTTVWELANAPGGTNDIVVDCTISGDTTCAMSAVEVTGATSAPFDKQAQASGTSTSPSSGATATTAQAAELLLGFVGTNGPVADAAGTWSNSFNDGQRAGTSGGTTTNMTISDGYLVVAATGAYTAAKTGITSRSWDALIVTYKEAASTDDLSTRLVRAGPVNTFTGG
jgi:hypothetical protein